MHWTEYQSEMEIDTICVDMASDRRFAKVEGAPLQTPLGEIYKGLDRDTGNEVTWRVVNLPNGIQGI